MIRPDISRPSRRLLPGSRRAFTLIELLVVMAIMLILAGLIIAVAGNAQRNSSFARAQSEITALSTAMESYKVDNGIYPRDVQDTGTSATDSLNAQTTTDADTTYQKASIFLYEALSGIIDPSKPTVTPKAYMPFLPGQLSTGNVAPTFGTTYIIDPWGLSYGYSTAYQAMQDQVNAGTKTAADLATVGYNPTYDLWSTAGYGKGGKSYPATTSVPAANRYTLWAKNW